MSLTNQIYPEAITKSDVETALQIVRVVADAIRELGSVPSGHLYARVCGHFSLAQYQSILDTLVRAQLIKVENHLITWTGGTP